MIKVQKKQQPSIPAASVFAYRTDILAFQNIFGIDLCVINTGRVQLN